MSSKKVWHMKATQETEEGITLEISFENRGDAYYFAEQSLATLAVEKGLNPVGHVKTLHFKIA